ncbi:MAG: U32 family peptidase [Bacteroidales bacterium]|nr:U32 family peptidase [Bacteroidales bacterium]
MTALELLAPARNLEIGIAAIDCGADAVYIAGPSHGARKDAANSIEDIRALCDYAHKYGVRIFATVNTIVFEEELQACYELMLALQDAGVDALIVQDPALLVLACGGPDGKGRKVTIPLHASTQCAIRTPEKAAALENAGFSRLVLERQLSLDRIRKIRSATSGEIEFFVHGALCVSYSGECYLSEKLAGRSANRGACIQACRARYNLADAAGKLLVKDRPLLSLKDYNLINRLGDLADAGVCSFKIEGRLKNLSYVKNVVSAYSQALDRLIAGAPDKYCRASAGRSMAGFLPQLEKTFNRGYTELFIDGKRGAWAGTDAPKSMGEKLGRVISVASMPGGRAKVTVDTKAQLSNGDGFAFAGKNAICGVRGDVCQGNTIICKMVRGLAPGVVLYRNLSASFEKEISGAPSKRVIDVSVSVDVSMPSAGVYLIELKATSADGRSVTVEKSFNADAALQRARMAEMITGQLSKSSGHYVFTASLAPAAAEEALPHLSAALLNGLRRDLAAALDALPCQAAPLRNIPLAENIRLVGSGYKANIANSLSSDIYKAPISAYELEHPRGAELMRSKYCIRHELGLCPKHAHGKNTSGSLYLTGNGAPLELRFNCAACEMSVIG